MINKFVDAYNKVNKLTLYLANIGLVLAGVGTTVFAAFVWFIIPSKPLLTFLIFVLISSVFYTGHLLFNRQSNIKGLTDVLQLNKNASSVPILFSIGLGLYTTLLVSGNVSIWNIVNDGIVQGVGSQLITMILSIPVGIVFVIILIFPIGLINDIAKNRSIWIQSLLVLMYIFILVTFLSFLLIASSKGPSEEQLSSWGEKLLPLLVGSFPIGWFYKLYINKSSESGDIKNKYTENVIEAKQKERLFNTKQ
ncbi:hypothetical protein KC614_02305 [candidate division WWE3 bacterium]|uniref:Uncharacterized protein n=1 Tax=candidate division WWE3 bacterium TaxID=2053526 RepID=A0A955LK86_UNCKA|nr:hypothetical protein [candidate division WWE3 bacterium]